MEESDDGDEMVRVDQPEEQNEQVFEDDFADAAVDDNQIAGIIAQQDALRDKLTDAQEEIAALCKQVDGIAGLKCGEEPTQLKVTDKQKNMIDGLMKELDSINAANSVLKKLVEVKTLLQKKK